MKKEGKDKRRQLHKRNRVNKAIRNADAYNAILNFPLSLKEQCKAKKDFKNSEHTFTFYIH